jgi:lysophospholipase L1-like esterase
VPRFPGVDWPSSAKPAPQTKEMAGPSPAAFSLGSPSGTIFFVGDMLLRVVRKGYFMIRDRQNVENLSGSGTGTRHWTNRARGWFRNVLIAGFLTLLVSACGAELFLRYLLLENQQSVIQSPQIPDLEKIQSNALSMWRLLPGLKDVVLKTYSVDGVAQRLPKEFMLSTNENGFRGEPLKPLGSRVRILALGDSTTFGLCVNDSETWPAQLQKLLNEEAGFEKYEVINGGVTGYTAYQVLRRIEEWLALRPRIVILTFGNNDRVRWDGISDIERQRFTAGLDPEGHGLRVAAFLRLSVIFALRKGDNHPRLSSAEYVDSLRRMHGAFSQNGTSVTCILWPQALQIEQGQHGPVYYQDDLRKYCRDDKIHLVDLIPPFSAAKEPLYCDSVHTNPTGCALVARSVAQWVRSLEESNEVPDIAPTLERKGSS